MCDVKQCPADCSGHGACNPFTGECSCYKGWGGSDCTARPPDKLWAYTAGNGKVAPSNWGELTPDYRACASGSYQSPVALPRTGMAPFFHKLSFNYSASGGYTLANNGRFLTLFHPPGNEMIVRDHRYELKNVTVHSPSEHMIGNIRFAVELQLHHQDSFGNLASVAILFKNVKDLSGEFYARYTRNHFWSDFVPAHSSSLTKLSVDLNPYLPSKKEENHYYVYRGSYTHPPCQEGVQWFVMKHIHEITSREINEMLKTTGENNRPVQPILGRQFHFF